MNPSVMILAEELTFLLSCYSALHQDARMGRVEAATGREEAAKLLQTFRPDIVVLDASAGDSSGFGAVMQHCTFSPKTRIVVTCDERDGALVARHARAIGAVGFLRHESVTGEALTRALQSADARSARAGAVATA